jgi:hypothetical protein
MFNQRPSVTYDSICDNIDFVGALQVLGSEQD